jgi:hypothetical protein
MADPKALAETLNELLDECATTTADWLLGCANSPRANATRDATPITAELLADGRLPKPLERLLAEYIAHPEHSPEVHLAVSSAMQEFGLRMFRRLTHLGLNRRERETDQAQNDQDVAFAAHLLRGLSDECDRTPFMARGAAELLGRVANALHDVWWNAGRPALFGNLPPPEGSSPNTAGIFCEGHLAAALEILIRGGMKPAAATKWIEAQMGEAGLVDAAGNAIGGRRVASWRNNFRKGVGAKYARAFFSLELYRSKPLLGAPTDGRKLAASQHRARTLVGMLAVGFNRALPPPVKH